ncbi:hypothetical protein LBMAG56_02460 [Verrucomicrobiota bacterium]|nr:hypothetical protein LBMAG56_02460 [Verrucomicrobiota bacterium]
MPTGPAPGYRIAVPPVLVRYCTDTEPAEPPRRSTVMKARAPGTFSITENVGELKFRTVSSSRIVTVATAGWPSTAPPVLPNVTVKLRSPSLTRLFVTGTRIVRNSSASRKTSGPLVAV